MNTNHTTHRRRLGVAALTALLLVPGATACSGPEPTPCDALPHDDTSSTRIGLLGDGSSEALAATVDAIVADPEQVGLDLLGGEPGDGAPTVELWTYDGSGGIDRHGTFDLDGVGTDDRRRRLSARRQGQCLAAAVADLPDAAGGDLLRALEPAVGTASAGADRSAVVAFGLGRSTIDGQPLAEVDLGPDGRTRVMEALTSTGLVPDLTPEATVRFVAPGEGVESAVSAAGIEEFAADLCEQVGSADCSTGTTVQQG